MGKVLFDLIKATRAERSLIPVSFIMIAVALANNINAKIFILMACCVMMYVVGGLLNAKADKDFPVKKINIAIVVLLLFSIFLSFYDKVIFFAVFTSLFMGYMYNKVFRSFLFGDSVALSFTHVVIPLVSSSLILGLSPQVFLPLIPFSVLPVALITPMKNLKGITDDKKNNYKTLMTTKKNGKQITHVFLSLFFILLFSAYFFLDVGKKFLFVVFLLFIVKVFMDSYMNYDKEVVAYGLVRLVIISIPFAFVFDKSSNILFIGMSFSFILIYFLYFISKTFGVQQVNYV